MEFIIPTSIVSIIAICLLAAFVAIQIVIDARDIRRSKQLYRKMIKVAKKHSKQSFTVLVELSRNAGTIIPLLDHLYAQQYSKLEVIVVAKHTAGKNARTLLAQYRRTHRIKGLKIVKHVRGLSLQDILRRFGSGRFAMTLSADERLSDNFFVTASLETLLSDTAVALLPRHHVRLATTITSALQAQFNTLKQLTARVFGTKTIIAPLTAGVIYKRSYLITNNPPQSTTVRLATNQLLYVSRSADVEKFSNYFVQSIKKTMGAFVSVVGIIASSCVIIAVAALIIFVDPHELWIVAIVVIALYIMTNLTMQIRTKGYSFVDRINLLLTIPIGLIYATIIGASSLVALLISVFFSKRRKNKSTTLGRRALLKR